GVGDATASARLRLAEGERQHDHRWRCEGGEGGKPPVMQSEGHELSTHPRAEDRTESSHAGRPPDGRGPCPSREDVCDCRVHHRLGAEEEEPGDEHNQISDDDWHLDAEEAYGDRKSD